LSNTPAVDFNQVKLEDLADYGITVDHLVSTLEEIQKAQNRVSLLEKEYPTVNADFYEHSKNSQKNDYLAGLQF
jgi:hypothetical protein